MSGHSKWSQIKHKKAVTDQKRGQLFSKFSKIISVAARKGTDPSKNTELKNAIERARTFNMPNSNIEKAIKHAEEKDVSQLEELQIEAVAPENTGFIIKIITDNKNRTISEIKNLCKKYDIKMVQPGALSWMFEKKITDYEPKIMSTPSEPLKKRLEEFLEEITEHDDIEKVYDNIGHLNN